MPPLSHPFHSLSLLIIPRPTSPLPSPLEPPMFTSYSNISRNGKPKKPASKRHQRPIMRWLGTALVPIRAHIANSGGFLIIMYLRSISAAIFSMQTTPNLRRQDNSERNRKMIFNPPFFSLSETCQNSKCLWDFPGSIT